ncbi:MAG TPA: PAS domain S-box protein [Candidatus Acidoferrales bacterium]|nr:PAS domain S-box protein [Candidatus Acidoferrales bacterium]
MRKDSPGIKLGIAFGFLISILIGVGWLGLSRMRQINAGVDEILDKDVVKLELANQAMSYISSNYRMTMVLVLMKHTDAADVEWYPPRRAENREKIELVEKQIGGLADSEQERKLLAKILEVGAPTTESVSKIVELLRIPGKESKARELMTKETAPLLNQYRETWLALVRYEDDEIARAKARNEANYAATRRLSVLLVFLAISLAIGTAVFVTRLLSRDIRDREESKVAIRRLNEDLEAKVAARTEELARTAETLKVEMIERRAREKDSRRLAAIVECSDDAIIAATLDGVITDWNAGAERMLGYSRDEVIGKPIALIAPPELSEEPLQCQRKLLQGDSAVRLESVRIRKDGKAVRVAISISPIINQDGRIIGGSAILRDITERKFMEDALRRSEAGYRSFVENAPYGILRTTLDGRIITANPALVEMLGYASEREVLGLRMATDVYLRPEDRDPAIQWVRKHDSAQGVEKEWKHKSGKPFTVRCSSHVVRDSKGNVEFLEGFVEDISERRTLEMQFRQAQKMEAIGRLAGGIAHDFNNLLGVIIGYGDLVSEQAGHSSPLLSPIEQIRKAAERASALTRQLLAFSRQQVLEMKVLNLNSVVMEIGKMLRPLLGEDILLEMFLDPEIGLVKADQGQVEQAIMNLAVNARDAMPGGGRLLIQTTNASVDPEFALKRPPMIPGEYVMLLVKDTGMGMDAQTQAHIFEPFFTTKEQGKGTGLGLATVYGFVKQSGGFVWVDSEPGAGAVFTIYLPLASQEASQHHPSATRVDSGRRAGTVLLVEDEDSLRTLTRNVLEQGGYTVLEAGNGIEAVQVAQAHSGPIHLLLTDMVMPGMNGRAVAAKLSSMYPEIRIAYMSGYTGFSEAEYASLDAPIIAKPFTRAGLLQKLNEVLDLEQDVKQI